jgi:hypothetical protein
MLNHRERRGGVAIPNRIGLIVWGMVVVVICLMAIDVVRTQLQ